MKKIKLKEIADIYYGPQEKSLFKGSIKYITSSHFDDLFQPSKFKESYIDSCKDEEKYLLKPNDLIITGKGHRLFAWAYNPIYGDIVPSSIFYIIKIKDSNIVKGEYLADAINTEKINFKLKSIGAGTSIPSIQKNELAQLEFNIPSLEEQDKIIKLARLLDKDIELYSQILEKKKALKKSILNIVINDKNI